MKSLDDKSNYLNRELSWLAFNARVLNEAGDKATPLFERLKFLSIVAANLDEFFMVRVAGLKYQIRMGYRLPENKTQMTPQQQLDCIAEIVKSEVQRMHGIVTDSILPELKREGIQFLKRRDLTKRHKKFLSDYFHHHIFPVLTPLAVNASHPFPMLAGRTLNIAVLLQPTDEPVEMGDKEERFGVVPVPSVLPRFVSLPSPPGEQQFIFLETVIQQFLDTLFPGHQVLHSSAFRITRNADFTVDEEGADDLLEEIEKELKKRKRGTAVRLEIGKHMTAALLEPLLEWLELEDEDVYSTPGPIDLRFYGLVHNLPGFHHLRYRPFVPQPPRDLIGETGIFDAISRKDILLCHPFESFQPVVHFVRQAAADPNVLAIKQTLYRVSGNSPVVNALAEAAENGKQVTVLLELKARFDEENNIVWAKRLEEAGCHVIYGVIGLKTHCKVTLVIRREGHELRRYVHLSTGNYNDITAKLYTDIGLFTANEDFASDASELFNHLTGFSKTPSWRVIEAAPSGLKDRLMELIHREVQKSSPKKPGHIIAKMNSLTDKDLIKALYTASRCGVQVDLIVRGICCLRPGIPNVSENIRVSSVVGRFLEHGRIFYFQNGDEEEVFLSSADWMTRNMAYRVELMFPVRQPNLKDRLKHILAVELTDNFNRYVLNSSGTYEKVVPGEGEEILDSQSYFYEEAMKYAQATTETSDIE